MAGLAVECLFRAFKGLQDRVFDERHDLDRFFRESGIQNLVPEAEKAEFRAAADDLGALWRNSLRYYSEDRLRKHLKSDPALRKGIKGDILKEHARRLLQASRLLVKRGTALWTF